MAAKRIFRCEVNVYSLFIVIIIIIINETIIPDSNPRGNDHGNNEAFMELMNLDIYKKDKRFLNILNWLNISLTTFQFNIFIIKFQTFVEIQFILIVLYISLNIFIISLILIFIILICYFIFFFFVTNEWYFYALIFTVLKGLISFFI